MDVPVSRAGSYRRGVDVEPADPRDIQIEWDAVTYRVYFWSRDGSRCDEHELSGAQDVREVIAWADANAGDRVPEIFVHHDHPPQHGLIRLAGGRPGIV
jgi:hypothetical protein